MTDTDEIVIRATRPDDAPALARISNDPRVFPTILNAPHMGVSLWQERLAGNDKNVHSLVACLADQDGDVVGSVALVRGNRPRIAHRGTIGIMVHGDHQGRGIGRRLLTEVLDMADNWLQVTRVELGVMADNDHARRLYESLGFVEEGVQRKAAFRNGEYVDDVLMARLHPRLEAL